MKHGNVKCKICVEACCVGAKCFLYFLPPRESEITNTSHNVYFLNLVSQLYLLNSRPRLQRDVLVKNIYFMKCDTNTLKYSYNKSQQDALFLNFILAKNSTCFGQTYCPSSGVLKLYSQQLVFVILKF